MIRASYQQEKSGPFCKQKKPRYVRGIDDKIVSLLEVWNLKVVTYTDTSSKIEIGTGKQA